MMEGVARVPPRSSRAAQPGSLAASPRGKHTARGESAGRSPAPTPRPISSPCDAVHRDALDALEGLLAHRNHEPAALGFALCEAARLGKVEMVRALLAAGACPDGVGDNHPLTHAVAFADIVERLLVAGGSRFAGDATLLHLAAATGSPATIAALIRRGAKVDATSHRGWTPLHRAAWTGDTANIEALVELGATVDARVRGGDRGLELEGGETALFIACLRGKHPIVKALLKRRADPNLANDAGENCCFAAARCLAWGNAAPIARSLLAKGGSPGMTNARGETAMEVAVSRDRVDVAGVFAS
jgi:ankyrin repeat protein